jgi:hypothetical protein
MGTFILLPHFFQARRDGLGLARQMLLNVTRERVFKKTLSLPLNYYLLKKEFTLQKFG